jgi:hypothetical protein
MPAAVHLPVRQFPAIHVSCRYNSPSHNSKLLHNDLQEPVLRPPRHASRYLALLFLIVFALPVTSNTALPAPEEKLKAFLEKRSLFIDKTLHHMSVVSLIVHETVNWELY